MQNKLGQLKLLMVYEAELLGGMDAEDVQAALNESLENFREVQQSLLKSGFMLQLANATFNRPGYGKLLMNLGNQRRSGMHWKS